MKSRAWTLKLAGLLCAAFCMVSAAAADFDGMVNVGKGQLHAVKTGEGLATIVFEAGFASDLSTWRKVTPLLVGKAQLVTYSRAGYGKSPARAQTLSMADSVAEFSELLVQLKVTGPVILVGHSYGGFLIRSFAASHPQQVAGLVFVDPADEGLETVLRAIDPVRLQQDQRMLVDNIPARWQGDLQMIQGMLDAGKLPAMAALPDVPAVLITSVRARAGSDFYQETPEVIKIKRERHGAFINQFSNGAHMFTAGSGHAIQLQQPELVASAIDQVLARAGKP